MTKKYEKILGQDLAILIAKGLGLDPLKVRRVVLDVGVNCAVVAYVELIGDERLIEIDWSGLGVEISE